MSRLLRRHALAALSLLLLGLHAPAQAQSFPSKNLTIIVSLGAGTGMDVLTRLYADKLSQALGRPVVVENKPGAATMLAAVQGATAAPDGHTLVVLTSSAMSINPWLYKQINYNPDQDFVPISLYVKSPFILVANPVRGGEDRAGVHQAAPRNPSRRSITRRSGRAPCSTCRWSSPRSGSASTPRTCRIAPPASR